MQLTAFATDVNRERLELCRGYARSASTKCSYSVYPSDRDDWPELAFSQAFELLRSGKARSIRVIFEWSFAGMTGRDAVQYFTPPYSTVTETFVRQVIGNLMIQKIAAGLYERSFRDPFGRN